MIYLAEIELKLSLRGLRSTAHNETKEMKDHGTTPCTNTKMIDFTLKIWLKGLQRLLDVFCPYCAFDVGRLSYVGKRICNISGLLSSETYRSQQ